MFESVLMLFANN